MTDISGSMGLPYSSGGLKIDALKTTLTDVNNFMSGISSGSPLTNNRGAIATFSDNGNLVSGLTGNFAALNSQVSALSHGGATNLAEGLQVAYNQILPTTNASRTPLVILISDGEANVTLSPSPTGNAKNDSTVIADQIAALGYVKILSVAINGTSFDVTPLQYAAAVTGGQLVYADSGDRLSYVIESYLADICDFANLSPRLTMNPDPVQLEEHLEYNLQVRNACSADIFGTGNVFALNNARNVSVQLDLNTLLPAGLPGEKDIDLIGYSPASSDWACVMDSVTGVLDCNSGTNEITACTTSSVATVTVRVPGSYYHDDVQGRARVLTAGSVDYTDVDDTDDEISASADVEKNWIYSGEDALGFESVTHASFDNSITDNLTTPGVVEYDFKGEQVVVNPLQVPLRVAFGATLTNYPTLIAQYCFDLAAAGITPPAQSCIDPDDYLIEGAVLIQEVELDELTFEDGITSIQMADFTGMNLEIGDRSAGQEGRYVDADEARCMSFSSHVNGGCVEYHASYPSSLSSNYQYVDSEYIAFVFKTAGGRELTCASTGVAATHCHEDSSATPGSYALSGTMYGESIFHDVVKLKTMPGNLVRLDLVNGAGAEIETTLVFVSPFVEQE